MGQQSKGLRVGTVVRRLRTDGTVGDRAWVGKAEMGFERKCEDQQEGASFQTNSTTIRAG